MAFTALMVKKNIKLDKDYNTTFMKVPYKF